MEPFYDAVPVVSLRSTTGYWLFSLREKESRTLPEVTPARILDSLPACADCRTDAEADRTAEVVL